MDNESSDRERDPHDDPELEALLAFEPVPRKCPRRHGWTPDNQRGFVAGLARTGSADLAAQSVGLTARGAYELCKSAGSEGFKAAWDAALALHARRGGRAQPPARRAAEPAAAPQSEEAAWQAFVDSILTKYLLKLDQERSSRLAGRVVEADFYVRQLTWLEIALDLGGRGPELLKRLKRGGRHAGQIVATPMSVLLDSIRRAYWAEDGGPERPPLAALGLHDDEVSTGPPMECQYDRARDGDYRDWPGRRSEREALAAEAQRAWEEKARKDAAAWAKREEGGG